MDNGASLRRSQGVRRVPGRAPGAALQNKGHRAPAVCASPRPPGSGSYRCLEPTRPPEPLGLLQPPPLFPGWGGGLPEQLVAGDQGSEVSTGQAAEWLFLRGVQRWHCPAGRCRGGRDHSEERHGARKQLPLRCPFYHMPATRSALFIPYCQFNLYNLL